MGTVKKINYAALTALILITLAALSACSPAAGSQQDGEAVQSEAAAAQDSDEEAGSEAQIPDIERKLIDFAAGLNDSFIIINKGSTDAALALGRSTGPLYLSGHKKDNRNLVVLASYAAAQGSPPAAFHEKVPGDGYISTPTGGECPLGAATSMMFSTAAGNDITAGFLEGLSATAVPYDILSLPAGDPGSIQYYINQELTSDPTAYADSSSWDNNIWGPVAGLQEPVESIIGYHFWSNGPGIESIISDSIRQNLPPVTQVLDAFDSSGRTGFIASPPASAGDLIARKNIKAVFSGDVEGTVYESRDFSLELGGSPAFGPMHGEGMVTLKDTSLGDIPVTVELDLTAWDDMGAPTQGTALLYNDDTGYSIQINTYPDGTRDGALYLHDGLLGRMEITSDGVTYDRTGS